MMQIGRKKNNANREQKNSTDDKLSNAVALFMITPPFSLDELRHKRKKLLKAFHPDADGGNISGDEVIRINTAFELLKGYATK